MFSGRTQKRVWAVLVALAVLGCSGITGLSPAQGADNTLPISYDFQVVTLGNDKKIVVDFDYALTGINNPAGITVDKGAALGAPTVKDGKLELIVQDLDPAVTDYTITIPGGTLVLANYTQGGDIRIKFNPYDITPGFGSLFQGNNPTRANIIFAQNDPDEITMHIPGTYITNITVLTQLDPDRAKSTAEVTVNTREVHSVKITINGTENKVDRNRGTFEAGIFKQAFQGVAEGDDIFVYAYDVNGSFLGRKVTRISGDDATSFDPAQDVGYARQTKTVKDYLDGTITLVDLIGNRPVSELENIRVQYNNVPYIRTAANAGELSYAVAELTKYQLSNVGANTWLRLTGDVGDLTINEFSFPVDGMRIASSVPGTKRLLNGNIKLGDGVNTMSLSLTDVNIAGNLDIDVGNTGHVTLNNVTATSITVTSAGPNSVELNGVTANNLTVQNNNGPVRVIAAAGTAIGTTIINNDGRFNVELRQNGGQFTAVRANNTAGAGSLILSGNGTATTFPSLELAAQGGPARLTLGANVSINSLLANSPAVLTGSGATSRIITATAGAGLNNGAVEYTGLTFVNPPSPAGKFAIGGGGGGGTAAPAWATGYPKVQNVKLTEFELAVKTDKTGTVYYVLLANGAGSPTPAEVAAGTGAGGSAAVKAGTIAVTANLEEKETISGLPQNTAYDLWAVARDTATGTLQLVAYQIDVQTAYAELLVDGTLAKQTTNQNNIKLGERDLTLVLTGDVRWADDMVSDGAKLTALKALICEDALGTTPATDLTDVLTGANLRLSINKQTLYIDMPQNLGYSDVDATNNADKIYCVVMPANNNDALFVNAADGGVTATVPEVRATGGYRNQFTVEYVSDLSGVNLAVGPVPAAGSVTATIYGLASDTSLEYSFNGITWTTVAGATATGTVTNGSTVTVREKADPANKKQFVVLAGEAWFTGSSTPAQVRAALADNTVTKVHLAPGLDYDISGGGLAAITRPAGNPAAVVTAQDNAAGAKITFANKQVIANNIVLGQKVDAIPLIVAATLAADNSYFDLQFSEGVYGGAAGALTALEAADLALTFVKGGGVATNAAIASVKKTDGSALAGGETTIRVFLTVTGIPNGQETIEIKPATDAVFDATENVALDTYTTEAINLNSFLKAATLAANNSYIDLEFIGGVYGDAGAATALVAADLDLTFTPNGGAATDVDIASVKKTDGSALAAGDTIIRVFLTVTGTPDGKETIEIKPKDITSIYDKAGNAAILTNTTGAINLNP